MRIRKTHTDGVVDMRDWPVDVLAQDRQPSVSLSAKITQLFSVTAFKLAVAGLEKAGDPPPQEKPLHD